MYFDSHAHYYDARFRNESAEGVYTLLDSLFHSDVTGIVNVGTNPKTSREALEMALRFPRMYAAAGLHPSDAQEEKDVDKALSEIEKMLSSGEKKLVALGEIGLDYHYPDTDKPLQAYAFRKQMEMAERLSLPVIIHDREAHGDVLDVISEFPRVRGVFHSFSGSLEMAQDLIRRGYMISFSGTVTFTNARKVAAVAAALPKEAVMIETDCPYLAPHPLRGTLNHSGNLRYTNAAIASLWGVSEKEAARITEENAKRFFRI
jgi:TatD DNase family protein